eukprot:350264-Chlamydomonas_euryale.AAC.10
MRGASIKRKPCKTRVASAPRLKSAARCTRRPRTCHSRRLRPLAAVHWRSRPGACAARRRHSRRSRSIRRSRARLAQHLSLPRPWPPCHPHPTRRRPCRRSRRCGRTRQAPHQSRRRPGQRRRLCRPFRRHRSHCRSRY